MKITDFLREELVLPEIRATRKADVIRELAAHLANLEGVNQKDLERVLLERERLGSTALGEGIAIPHGKLDSADRLIGCLGRSRKGIDFESVDGKPTHFFFLLAAPQSSVGEHLKALAGVSRVFKESPFRARLMAAETAHDMYRIIEEGDAAASR